MPAGESILPESLATFATALLAVFLVALWASLILWTAKDIRARSDERLAQILAVLVVVLLNIPGLVLYLLLRPAQTLDEAYQSSLEEEALLAALSERRTCPGCGRQVEEDWRICPTCTTLLRKPCTGCKRLLELSWSVCPYCGTAAGAEKREAATPAA
jgi:RNA polymerase subunit RPABC4/transcription elongation factor Spt4